jgi:hypothetical protein
LISTDIERSFRGNRTPGPAIRARGSGYYLPPAVTLTVMGL